MRQQSKESDYPYRFFGSRLAVNATPLVDLDGLRLPLEYRWLRASGIRRVIPWEFCDDPEHVRVLRSEFRRETSTNSIPITDILPFAFCPGTDDIVGFVVDGAGLAHRVAEVHLTWKFPEIPGYPNHTLFDSIWAWLPHTLDYNQDGSDDEFWKYL
jgi:hypothetical protein